MTPIESSILTQTESLLAPSHDSPLDQRLAIALLQARAQECRHIAGQLDISGASRVSSALWSWRCGLLQRSSDLEAIGLEWAKEWPRVEEEKLVVM